MNGQTNAGGQTIRSYSNEINYPSCTRQFPGGSGSGTNVSHSIQLLTDTTISCVGFRVSFNILFIDCR